MALGCATEAHVRLRAPPGDAAEQMRLAAYESLRADPRRAYLDETLGELRLGDGTSVSHAEDILPVVPPRSRAALAARESESMERWATRLLVAGTLTTILAGVLAVRALNAEAEETAGTEDTALPYYLGGIGLGVVVAALSAVPEWQANDARHDAFTHYDAALRHRLRLCVVGLHVAACE